MRKMTSIICLALLFTGGCSTIINGTTQNVFVTTTADGPVECEVKDEKSSYHVTAPGGVSVARGDGPLRVTCVSGNVTGTAVVAEDYDATSMWLGHGSLAIDAITGAYQHYPPQVIVPMK